MSNDRTDKIDETSPAEPFDDALRWLIPSESNPHESYVIQLDSFRGNGECQCQHFECRLRPLLSRFISPEEAVSRDLVKLKKGMRVEDALRCKHIIDAQKRFACAMVNALSHARKAHTTQTRRSA
jgi:hypothetical protein